MTYNQMVEEVRGILAANAMINTVKFATPLEWINFESNPELPVALYAVSAGTYDQSYQNRYAVKFWFLDKSGPDGEFETEVISDMHSIGRDIVNALGLSSRPYSLELPIQWEAISEKFEDFLSGVTFTAIIQTTGNYTYCDTPLNP